VQGFQKAAHEVQSASKRFGLSDRRKFPAPDNYLPLLSQCVNAATELSPEEREKYLSLSRIFDVAAPFCEKLDSVDASAIEAPPAIAEGLLNKLRRKRKMSLTPSEWLAKMIRWRSMK
jgi:hypothetical protein